MTDDESVNIAPPKRVGGRIEALMEQFKSVADKTYGKRPVLVQSERLAEEVPYTPCHMALLDDPSLLETLVRFGESYVRDVPDIWRVLFLAQASCYAPPIMQGEKRNRAQTHMLILGEYATAKTSLYRMAMSMFPRATIPTEFTPAAFMGTVKKDGVRIKGIAEESDRAIIIIDEFDKIMAKHPTLDGILRIVMEEQSFYRRIAYGSLRYETHPVIFAGANPKNDVFTDEILMDQVPFKYGLLSRFDYVRPLAYGTEKIRELARYMANTCFRSVEESARGLAVDDVLKMYYALQASLIQTGVRQVKADHGLIEAISERFEKVQAEVDGMPILSIRDLMSAMRFLNASATLFIRQRKVEGFSVVAQEEDLANALYLLDTTAKHRHLFLTSAKRLDVAVTPYDKAVKFVQTVVTRKMPRMEVADRMMENLGVCRATAYNYLNQMVIEGRIRQVGVRDADLLPP